MKILLRTFSILKNWILISSHVTHNDISDKTWSAQSLISIRITLLQLHGTNPTILRRNTDGRCGKQSAIRYVKWCKIKQLFNKNKSTARTWAINRPITWTTIIHANVVWTRWRVRRSPIALSSTKQMNRNNDLAMRRERLDDWWLGDLKNIQRKMCVVDHYGRAWTSNVPLEGDFYSLPFDFVEKLF